MLGFEAGLRSRRAGVGDHLGERLRSVHHSVMTLQREVFPNGVEMCQVSVKSVKSLNSAGVKVKINAELKEDRLEVVRTRSRSRSHRGLLVAANLPSRPRR